MTTHRRTSPKIPMLIAAILLVLFGAALIGRSTVDTTTTASTKAAATKTIKVKVPYAVAAATPGPVAQARKVKPLSDLVKGDRVLYNSVAGGSRQKCTWVYWGGSIDFAAIDCGKGTITVKTGFLTPVEPQ